MQEGQIPAPPNARVRVTAYNPREAGGLPNPEPKRWIEVGEDPTLLDATSPREMVTIRNWGPDSIDILSEDGSVIKECRRDEAEFVRADGPIWAKAKAA